MSEKLKIMIVDDSIMMVQTIQKYLEKYNFEVVGTARDGKSAIEVFKKTSPDIVTMDITMPEIDGLTVMEEMLKIRSSVKIIIITALNDRITGITAIKKGAKDFLGKPFTEDKFKEVFERIL
jgi:two-component system chemotaxis response regulator CheY